MAYKIPDNQTMMTLEMRTLFTLNLTLRYCPQGEESLGPPIMWQFKLFFHSPIGSKNLPIISEHSMRSKQSFSEKSCFQHLILCKQDDHGGLSRLFNSSVLEVEPRSENLVKGTCINAFIRIERWNQTFSDRKGRTQLC